MIDVAKVLMHNGRLWHIIKINNSYFARQGSSDTGPCSTVAQAEEFIRAIPAITRRNENGLC